MFGYNKSDYNNKDHRFINRKRTNYHKKALALVSAYEKDPYPVEKFGPGFPTKKALKLADVLATGGLGGVIAKRFQGKQANLQDQLAVGMFAGGSRGLPGKPMKSVTDIVLARNKNVGAVPDYLHGSSRIENFSPASPNYAESFRRPFKARAIRVNKYRSQMGGSPDMGFKMRKPGDPWDWNVGRMPVGTRGDYRDFGDLLSTVAKAKREPIVMGHMSKAQKRMVFNYLYRGRN